jgi:hypothetical protein
MPVGVATSPEVVRSDLEAIEAEEIEKLGWLSRL